MPASPLEVAGAAIQPTAAAPLHTNEFFTGLWNNGNPLGPGPVPYLYQKFYSASRYDRLIDGANVEVSSRLTLIRRAGSSVYNSQLFPPINRFYEWRGFNSQGENIRIMASCDGYPNELQNPSFVQGAAGWQWQTGWSLAYAGLPIPGMGNSAMFSGATAGKLVNLQQIPCVYGQSVDASCWGLGEPGAVGLATLQINFYDASNTLISNVQSGGVPNNYVWTPVNLSWTAPFASAYATVDFSVSGSSTGSPRWFVWGFSGGISPSAATVRDVTGPSTNQVIQTKSPNAGRTSFVSVGNHLYWGDGAQTGMLVQSELSWISNTNYNPGDFIIDPNGNVQQAIGAQTGNITNIKVENYGSGSKFTLWIIDPLAIVSNVVVTFNGLTTCAYLNGQSIAMQVDSETQFHWTSATLSTPVAYSPETGTISTSGTSGGTQPNWQTTVGAITSDGANQWVNMGPAAQAWGLAAPTTAPSVSQAAAPSIYPAWAANTWYSPSPFTIVDSNNNLQQLIGPSGVAIKTGSSAPTWQTVPGNVTTESTGGANAQWTCKGPIAWAASHAYATGDLAQATYTYTTVVPVTTYQWNGYTMVATVTYQQQPITVTSLFQCVQAGTSNANPPTWVNGVGTTTSEAAPSTVVWKNSGHAPTWPGSSQNLSIAPKVLDTANNVEAAQRFGESGATVTWATGGTGTTTADNTQSWVNAGSLGGAGTAAWQWAYSGKNSITGQVSPASPLSVPLTQALGQLPVIQGSGLSNPPYDRIVVWRTVQGGSTLMYDAEFPNPGPGAIWTYTDTNADPSSSTASQPGQLNPLILAPVAGQNQPPPSNFIPICYYLNRIWGFAANVLMYSTGPDQGSVMGSGDQGFEGVHQFTLPSLGVMLWPTSIGLIVLTNSDSYAVLGQGTYDSNGAPISPFYVINFQAGIGILSQDAFDVNGSTAYMQLNSRQLVSMDPGAGEVEVGFPIGGTFDAYLDPSQAYLAWHQGRSQDTALYVANGSQWWYRMAAVAAPESGNVWSPAAVIAAPGQVKAIKSVEISPGTKALLLGPSVPNNPILMRDLTTNADNGVPYPAHATIAAVVLAQPGLTATVQFVVVEERMIDLATPLTVRLLFDEVIYGSPDIHESDFRTLRNGTADPPNLPRQKSVRTQRLWCGQDPSTLIKCRYYQQDMVWASENYANEIYTNTVYGRLPEKARR